MKQRICLLLLSGMLFLPSGAAAYTAPQSVDQALIIAETQPTFQWADDASSCTALFPGGVTALPCTIQSVVTNPTCTEAGITTYTASVTGPDGQQYTDTKQLPISELGHNWDAGTITKQPTCTANGVKTYHCKRCPQTNTESIDKIDHTRVTISAVKPTCTKTGLTEGTRCTRCGIVLQKQETIPATGHNWSEKWVSRKATPTQNGMYSHTCTVCHAAETVGQFPRLGYVSASTRTYTGSKRLPSVRVINSKGTRLSDSHFSVTYDNPSSKIPGIYGLTVTLRGGSYSGTMRATYKIRPKSTDLSKLTAQKGAFLAQWKKKTTQVTGYQLQYSLRKDSDVAVTKTVKTNKTTKLTIKNLKKKRNYYVRVRTYKQVGSDKIGSVWSPWVRVTTK